MLANKQMLAGGVSHRQGVLAPHRSRVQQQHRRSSIVVRDGFSSAQDYATNLNKEQYMVIVSVCPPPSFFES